MYSIVSSVNSVFVWICAHIKHIFKECGYFSVKTNLFKLIHLNVLRKLCIFSGHDLCTREF